ncbi:MAG: metalloregulator ArsR/SmtB family transcription factor [Gammaproteobacteria bacterium]|nr:metalloregulator ArsR/SmtB family transcription factor [Gammaproteobacteria bacterium]
MPIATQSAVNPDGLLSFCKASAEFLRLEILRVLSVDSFGVMELCRIFDIQQPGISHHLKILANAELLVTRREGNSIFYRRSLISAEDPLNALRHSLFDSIDRISLRREVHERIALVHRERAKHSQAFFTKNADKFKENQNSIVSFDQYSGCIQDLLNNEHIPRKAVAMEVGPGEGELLKQLSRQFDVLYALDTSVEMLNKAKRQFDHSIKKNIFFICGDMELAIQKQIRVDLIILNMVLHHLPSPAEAFSQARRLMHDNGYLLIVDLSSHDQDWVRDNCGDLWLGFDTNDLDDWAAIHELNRSQSLYLGLRNGFQIQMALFRVKQNDISH